MGRRPCCEKEGLNKGAWTAMEDKTLMEYIKVHGEGRWRSLPKRAGLKRCGKSCRLRWLNYLRPDIKRGNITPDEDELIIRLHKLLGNRWSLIAGRLPGRTDNEIKNYWNTNLRKRANNQPFQASNTESQIFQKQKHNQKMNKAHQTNVVRTKAVRCTKVYINPNPQPPTKIDKDNHITIDDFNINPEINLDYHGNFDNNYMLDGLEEGKELKQCGFMMDNYTNEMDYNHIWELLDTNLPSSSKDNYNPNAYFASPISLAEPAIFSQELLEDWLGDNSQQVNDHGFGYIDGL